MSAVMLLQTSALNRDTSRSSAIKWECNDVSVERGAAMSAIAEFLLKKDCYLAEVIFLHDAIQLSLVQTSKQFVLYATSSCSRLEVATADVFDAFQTTSKVLDQFQLVLHVSVLLLLQTVDVEAQLWRWRGDWRGWLLVVLCAAGPWLTQLVNFLLKSTHFVFVLWPHLIRLPLLNSCQVGSIARELKFTASSLKLTVIATVTLFFYSVLL